MEQQIRENDEVALKFMDLAQVADYLKVSIGTVYRYTVDKENPLPSFKISGKNILVRKEELDTWIESHRREVEKSSPCLH